MAKICIDMDGVMADTYQKFADAYLKEFGREPTRAELLGKKVYELDGAGHLRDLMYEPGFFRDVAVMPGAREVVAELYDGHDVYVVTSTMEFRNSFTDKWDWLGEHFPFIHHSKIVFCGKKDVVRGDFMIDDKEANLAGFNGTGLLFTALDNHYITGYHRVNDWTEVREYFRAEVAAEIAEIG
ncbi:5' nucleotidase, NT5C type [Neolewinella antarctica]|uniref:5'(3')-deoxyribonucleotidase n=1 Tax=Neolewinella antarctica TaxID=442734 RepID=A0ABX0X741_9BACT|nr:5'(3')-deoxyribonucleotidase [Neolewinella antarctica]NJC25050.1 5'(3')-deoxyribonucleotidase [Neolewinella antarctica]